MQSRPLADRWIIPEGDFGLAGIDRQAGVTLRRHAFGGEQKAVSRYLDVDECQ
jgi:hypothetical protein